MPQPQARSDTLAPSAPVDDAKLQQIIVGGDVKVLVEYAGDLGTRLKDARLTTAQVRNFFGTVRQIEAQVPAKSEAMPADAYRRFVLLKPKLAYQAQRERENRKGEGMAQLAQVLSHAIDRVEGRSERFARFVDFFEAILAYHKAAGGS